VNDRLGVANGPVLVPALFKSGTQIAVVVNFAVENDPDAIVFVRHRLAPAAQIHNGQTTVSQPDAVAQVQSRVIRPSMRQSVAHHDQPRLADVAIQLFRNGDAANATHNSVVR
jgi:hypothetical protein